MDKLYHNDALRINAEAVARSLFPTRHIVISGDEIRVGTHGSLSIMPSTGQWFDHEAGIGGDMLQLVRHATGCGFMEAVEYAKKWDTTSVQMPLPKPKSQKHDGNRKRALDIWQQSERIVEGDPVSIYLAKRGMNPPYPSDLRIHPCLRHPISKALHPVMLAAFRDMEGTIGGVHRTFLTSDGSKAGV